MFAVLWLAALAGLCVLYVVPAIIAFRRRHPDRWPILAVNVCLSGTGLGWAAALIWALHAVYCVDKVAGSHGGASGLNVFADDEHGVRVIAKFGGGIRTDEAKLTTTAAVAEIERLSALRGRAPQRRRV
nr:superinfection immunity protein [Methylobacterium sp. L1A1]